MVNKLTPDELIGDYAREYYETTFQTYKKSCLKLAHDLRNGVIIKKWVEVYSDPKGNWVEDHCFSGSIDLTWMLHRETKEDPTDAEIKKEFDNWFLTAGSETGVGELYILTEAYKRLKDISFIEGGISEDKIFDLRDYIFMVIMEDTLSLGEY